MASIWKSGVSFAGVMGSVAAYVAAAPSSVVTDMSWRTAGTIPYPAPGSSGYVEGSAGGSGGGQQTITTLPEVSTAPSAAWGFRRMVAGYTGNLFRLVRASDSATLDIAQDATGGPDLTGYAAWVGASSSSIDLVYDQVGSNHLTQATAANRPTFNPLDAYRGAYGSTHNIAGNYWFVIPSTLTGDGRATTTFDVAHASTSNSGTGFCQLGAAYNGAGSRAVQLGSSNNPRVLLLNTAFQSTGAALARSQPQVLAIAYGASTDLIRVNGSGGSVTAGSAGTWAGGLVGRVSFPYGFGGQWFAKAIYPATLNTTDIAAVETALATMFPVDFTPDFRLVMPGNSIVQGAGAVRSLHNNPRQADAYFSQRADVINAGVFGQTAGAAYGVRSSYSAAYSASVRSFVVCPEPSNDIDAYGANLLTTVVASITGDTTNATNTILNASSTTGLSIGQYITGTGIPAGATITGISGSTITMSANATATATGVAITVKAAVTATRTSGSNVLTGIANFVAIANGLIVSGTGIPSQTTITSFDSGAGTITLSANATSSGTGTVVFTDPALVASRAATLWTGASGVKLFFDAMVAGGYAAGDVLTPTTLPRNWGNGENNSRFDQKEAVRLAFNALILADQATYGYTVLDYANIPAMANFSGPNYGDGTHPNSTNFASGLEVSGNGYGYLAKLLSDTINARL